MNIQIELAFLRAKEQQFREKRTEMEIRYKDLEAMGRKAEGMISQVSVAMDFLSGNIENIWTEVGKVQDREETIYAVIKAQEEERKRVARDIHDGPAQSLAISSFRWNSARSCWRCIRDGSGPSWKH